MPCKLTRASRVRGSRRAAPWPLERRPSPRASWLACVPQLPEPPNTEGVVEDSRHCDPLAFVSRSMLPEPQRERRDWGKSPAMQEGESQQSSSQCWQHPHPHGRGHCALLSSSWQEHQLLWRQRRKSHRFFSCAKIHRRTKEALGTPAKQVLGFSELLPACSPEAMLRAGRSSPRANSRDSPRPGCSQIRPRCSRCGCVPVPSDPNCPLTVSRQV